MITNKRTTDLTEGNIVRALVRFALPLCATYFLQLMFSTVDMAIVGNYIGESGVAAISSGSEIINLYTFFCIGFCNGGQALIAQLIGLGKKERFDEAISTVIISSIIMGFVICGVTILLKTQMIALLNVPDVSVIMSETYLTICSVGMIFSFGYNALTICFRAFGDSEHPLRIVIISTVVNIVLDFLFVGYLDMGVGGAALATAFGQLLSFILALLAFMRNSLYDGYEYRFLNISFNIDDFKTMLHIGFPLALQSAIVHFSMLYVNRMVNTLGVTAAATFAIGIKIDDICAKTSLGFQYAGGPIISQNFVKGNFDRVSKTVVSIWMVALSFHILYGMIYYIFPSELFSIFVGNNSPEVLALAPTFVKSILWTFVPLALLRGINALYIGLGAGRISLALSMFDSVAGRIGLSFLFGYVLNGGFAGFVLGYGLAPLGAAIPGLVYFLSGKWKQQKSLV